MWFTVVGVCGHCGPSAKEHVVKWAKEAKVELVIIQNPDMKDKDALAIISWSKSVTWDHVKVRATYLSSL